MHKLFLFLFLVSLVQFSGATTTIKCENPEYAGKKLDFYQYSDPITRTREFIFSLEFDANGKSSASAGISKTLYAFSDFGIYQGMLFLEPNQVLNLKLPPVREKSFADQKNPYFSPVAFWFNTEDKQQLNNQISAFTQTSNQLTDKFFNELYFRQSKEIFDSVSYLLNEEFPDNTSATFKTHKNLSNKLIEVDVFRLKPESYSSLFSSIKSEFWVEPAFINLFEKAFGGQLSFHAKSMNGKNVLDAVNKADISFLIQFVQNKFQINGDMADLALLKMLYDGFFSGDFSKNSIKSMVKNERFSNNANEIIKKASSHISERFNHLQQGTDAPVICLNDLEGNKTCTDENKDKFKYLVFADTEMIVCQEHLKYLTKIDERFQKHLEIIVVLRKSDLNKMKKFIDENKIPGIKLIDENDEWISKYRVRSFPSCFLLDENHKVKMVNAKAPLDGFEQQFGPFLQRELFKRQRN